MGLFHLEAVAAQGRLGHETRAMPDATDDIFRRKRLLWRATHRGIREMDLILGGFVARHLDGFSEADIAELERIMEFPDQEMLAWATRQQAIPADRASALLLRILDHRP
jgi:antitoxin CptB